MKKLKGVRIAGWIYSVLSFILLPFLFFMQVFSIFLFDDPYAMYSVWPYVLAICIFLIPLFLIVSNVLMWFFIREKRVSEAIYCMVFTPAFSAVFFTIWAIFSV